MDKQVFEIINLSDPYTLVGEYKVATIAISMVSEQLAINSEDGKLRGGLFAFGGFEKWCEKNKIKDIKAFLAENKEAIIDALDSVLIGGFGARKEVEKTLEYIPKEKHEAWLLERHDIKRSSLNDIGRSAWTLAKRLREQLQEAQ